MGEGPHEPLPGRHDLERALAPLVELDRMGDRAAARRSGRPTAASSSTMRFCAWSTVARQLVVGAGAAAGSSDSHPGSPQAHRQQPAVAPDDGPGRQAELAPPHHVGRVAEGADHGDARSLLGIGQLVGHDRAPRTPNRGVSTSVPNSGR